MLKLKNLKNDMVFNKIEKYHFSSKTPPTKKKGFQI